MHRRSMLIALAALTLTSSVAQSQIGGIRRKVRDAARSATGQRPRGAPPQFDNDMLELTPQVVARLIKGLEARSTARGAGGQTAAQLRTRSSAASEEAANINNQHSDERAQWVEADNNAESCVRDELNKANDAHMQAMQQRMMGMTGVNTPEKMKFMQDWTAAGAEAQQAAASNDSAGLRRAQEKLNKLMGIDAHADSAKARATCHVTPMPPWMRRADSLAAISDTLLVRARAVEDSSRLAASGAAGMTPTQFAMAAERAEAFVAMQKPGNVGSGYVFSKTEEDALTARLVDLKKYFG